MVEIISGDERSSNGGVNRTPVWGITTDALVQTAMRFSKITLAICGLLIVAVPSFARDAATAPDPRGRFVDDYGTSFSFKLCGGAGTDLCGVLTSLKGSSATPENLAFVGKQVMHAIRTAPNEWKGSVGAGGMSGYATITMVDLDTIVIRGCRAAILCATLAYHRT